MEAGPRIEQPPQARVRAFLQRNGQFIEEQRRLREQQITSLVGNPPSLENRDAAEALIEDGILSDPQSGRPALEQGVIAFLPPRGDKHAMIGLETPDPEIFYLFNTAAGRVTKDHGGFHQVGGQKTEGYTAWELWKQNGKKSYVLVEEVYNQMRGLSDILYPSEKQP